MTELPDRRELRASDSDRDRIASVLREAAGDGRLSLDELDERLSAVYAAKTYAELEPVVRDLPGTAGPSMPSVPDDGRFGGTPTSTVGIGIMSGFQHRGAWVVPREFTAVAFWGGGELDMREARFAEREVTIRAFAVMGGIEITVPEDAEVIVNGIGIMGGFDHGGAGAGAPGGPRIVISGFAFWGGVSVKRKRIKGKRQELDS